MPRNGEGGTAGCFGAPTSTRAGIEVGTNDLLGYLSAYAGGSSRIFSITALLIPEGTQHDHLQGLDIVVPQVGRRPGDPIHWQQVKTHGQRRHLGSFVSSLPDVQVISVVLCKHHLPSAAGLRNPGRLYNWTFRLLIERLSWFAQARGDQVSVTFAQVLGLHPDLLRQYIGLLQQMDTYIAWRSLVLPLRVNTPQRLRMLQLADIASGAVFAAFERDDLGYVTRDYWTPSSQ